MIDAVTYKPGPESNLDFRQKNVNFVACLNGLDCIGVNFIQKVQGEFVFL